MRPFSRLLVAAALAGLALPGAAHANGPNEATQGPPLAPAGDDADAPEDPADALAADATEEAPPGPDAPPVPEGSDVAPPAPGEPPATAASARAAHRPELDTPAPTEWLSAGPLGCIRRGRLRGFCQGPRRVPQPTAEQEEAARALGLGTDNVGHRLVIQPPEARWVEAAGGATDARPDLMFPVETAALWRGYGMTHRTVRARHGRRVTLHHAHMGVDLGAPEGTLVRAANDGIVAYANNGVRGYGNLVEVVHGDGSVTFYAHMRAAYVVPGMRVLRGQVLGEVGDTGFARGKHLHFEWHVGGAAQNPLPHFAALPPNVTPTTAQLDQRVVAPDRSVTHPSRGRHGRPTRRAARAAAAAPRPARSRPPA